MNDTSRERPLSDSLITRVSHFAFSYWSKIGIQVSCSPTKIMLMPFYHGWWAVRCNNEEISEGHKNYAVLIYGPFLRPYSSKDFKSDSGKWRARLLLLDILLYSPDANFHVHVVCVRLQNKQTRLFQAVLLNSFEIKWCNKRWHTLCY